MSLDGNTWYWITETRVNWTSGLFYDNTNNNLYFGVADNSSTSMQWQFYEGANGNYQIRNRYSNILKQLSVCYSSAEASPSKTQPCMLAADRSTMQKWVIEPWDDGLGFKITNKQNGTGLNMDWHPGGPGFMSPTTAEAPIQPAQHWLFSSLSPVNDGIYSTAVATASTTQTSSPETTGTTNASGSATGTAAQTGSGTAALASSTSGSTSQKSSSSSGLSSGAAAGIGVGVALVVLAIAGALLIFLIKKRKQRKSNAVELASTDNSYGGEIYKGHSEPKYADEPIYEAPNNTTAPQELYSDPAEMGTDSAQSRPKHATYGNNS